MWNLSFSRNLRSWELQALASLKEEVERFCFSLNSLDRFVWSIDSSGCFSIKSLFASLVNGRLEDHLVSSFPHDRIWSCLFPPRAKAFLWITVHDGMNTMDQMQKRHPYLYISRHMCPICKRDGENASHTLLHCRFSSLKWNHFIGATNLSWVMPRSIWDLLRQWWFPHVNHNGKAY